MCTPEKILKVTYPWNHHINETKLQSSLPINSKRLEGLLLPGPKPKASGIPVNHALRKGIYYKLLLFIYFIFLSGSAAQRELWPPRPRSFLITHNDAPQSVGPSGRVISSSQRLLPVKHTTDKDICSRWDFFF
jgi:hypothetical protein